MCCRLFTCLTHWGRMMHICVIIRTIIGSDNGLSPERRQAIIWTNVGILFIGTLGTNFSETISEIHTFSFKKMHLKSSSAKWRPFCLGLSVLIAIYICYINWLVTLVAGTPVIQIMIQFSVWWNVWTFGILKSWIHGMCGYEISYPF